MLRRPETKSTSEHSSPILAFLAAHLRASRSKVQPPSIHIDSCIAPVFDRFDPQRMCREGGMRERREALFVIVEEVMRRSANASKSSCLYIWRRYVRAFGGGRGTELRRDLVLDRDLTLFRKSRLQRSDSEEQETQEPHAARGKDGDRRRSSPLSR